MIAVITGDIIRSQSQSTYQWASVLETHLSKLAASANHWQRYRGDGFQILIEKPAQSIHAALMLKAGLQGFAGVDARIGVGIGKVNQLSTKISDSHGQAFVLAGEALERLERGADTLIVKTSQPDFDKTLNLLLSLAGIAYNHWTKIEALTVYTRMQYPDLTQTQLADKIDTTQDAISRALSRAEYKRLHAMLDYTQAHISSHF